MLTPDREAEIRAYVARHGDEWYEDLLAEIDRLREQLAEWTDRKCEHKWRDYEGIGVVCRDCGAPAE
jgi:hypothetical protein